MKRTRRILDTLTVVLIAIAGFAILTIALFGAVLQESYRMNPPTAEEIEQDPSLVRYTK